jgi:uncharacterized protein YgbK (DUF1537 family)
MMGLPDGLLLSFYGDDFTGSTDAMEVLAFAGLRTALFLKPPTAEQRARFDGLRAVGVAGSSRSMSPDEMNAHLEPVFWCLRALGAPITHYKVCSTFDSSPKVGSIGRALEIGASVFASEYVPVIVGAPALGRYCVFGNLFARSGAETEPFRLDRHPTMRHHPTTPMDESDLRLHLARQTVRTIRLFDALALDADDVRERFEACLAGGPEVVLFDGLTAAHLRTIGGLLWNRRPPFVVGSSGFEYAMTSYWRSRGWLPEPPPKPDVEGVETLPVFCGSCSPVTAGQITRAVEDGFVEVALRTERLVIPDECESEVARATDIALDAVSRGRSPLVHTCRGPDDPRIVATRRRLEATGVEPSTARTFGVALGRIAKAVVCEGSARRFVVAGGDTSFFAASEVGIEAVEVMAPVAPGSPLCRVYAADPRLDAAEALFKGGQVGGRDLFPSLRRGFRR